MLCSSDKEIPVPSYIHSCGLTQQYQELYKIVAAVTEADAANDQGVKPYDSRSSPTSFVWPCQG
jgi:hypothetical protein